MILRLLPAAALEAAEAAIWYEGQRDGLGSEFQDSFPDALHRIRKTPASYPILESWTGSDEVRRCMLNRFPYVVIFRSRPEESLVIAVAHGRRRPFYWLGRLG